MDHDHMHEGAHGGNLPEAEDKEKGEKSHELKEKAQVHKMHGPGAGKPGMEHKGHADHHEMMLQDFKKRFIISVILTIPVLILSSTVQELLGFTFTFPGAIYIEFLLSTIIYFYGGYPFLKGFFDELNDRRPGMMTLIAVAITVAYAYSTAVVFGLEGMPFFWELATLIDVMLLGHWIEMRSVLGASRALEELVKIMPSEAHLIKDGGTRDVRVDVLNVVDMVLVMPCEKVPIDVDVIDGASSVNEAMLTGESKPVEKNEGDKVIGGSINGEGSLRVEVKKTGGETYLNQVVDLVKRAQESKSRAQDLANNAAFILTLIALTAGAITFTAWLFAGETLQFAVTRTATVMVITCPHALGLAIPLVIAVSTSIAASSGLLIRDRKSFERARSLEAIVFDKTGTLTKGEFGVTDVITLSGIGEDEVLKTAAALESSSGHPVALGIVNKSKDRNMDLPQVSDFKSLPGKGIEGKINGKLMRVVSPGYLKENDITVDEEKIGRIQEQGKTLVFLLEDKKTIGSIALADIIREESKEAISRLKDIGIRCMMLTGDNRYVAQWVAEEIGLDEYFADVLPHEKSEKIKEVQEKYSVGMVGDGVNDAPALVQANVGIAIGAGTDVAIQSADVILVRNDPRDVVNVVTLSKNTYRKMLENLGWATGYNAFAIPLAAGILYGYGIVLSPAVGALLMSMSTVIVAINAKLLKM